MPTEQKTLEISAMFQKYLKNKDASAIENLSLEELKTADTDLGSRDEKASWRRELQNRIKKLEQKEQDKITKQKEQKKDRETTRKEKKNFCRWIIGILISIIIALIGWIKW